MEVNPRSILNETVRRSATKSYKKLGRKNAHTCAYFSSNNNSQLLEYFSKETKTWVCARINYSASLRTYCVCCARNTTTVYRTYPGSKLRARCEFRLHLSWS